MTQFNDLLAIPIRSGISRPQALRGSGIPMVNMRELFAHDFVGDVAAELVEVDEAERSRFGLLEGDLLFARQSLTFEGAGKVSYVQGTARPRVFESHILRARVSTERADPRFLYYYFSAGPGRRDVESIIHQVAAAGIRSTELGELRVQMPDLKSQEAVAEVLGTLDDKIAANRRLTRVATELQRQLWAGATTGLARRPLLEYTTPHLGGTPSRADESAWGGTVAWASVKDMSAAPEGILIKTAETISSAASGRVRRLTPLPTGSTFLSARGTVGCVVTNAMPCAINQSAYAFVAKEGRQVALRLAVESLVDALQARAHGSVFSTITMRTLGEAQVPDLSHPRLVPVSQQLEHLEARRVAAARENERLAATRDELLPLLISGRITVRDAEQRVEQEV